MLLEGDDNWLRICALYVVSALDEKELRPTCCSLKEDADPIVRETAAICIETAPIRSFKLRQSC